MVISLMPHKQRERDKDTAQSFGDPTDGSISNCTSSGASSNLLTKGNASPSSVTFRSAPQCVLGWCVSVGHTGPFKWAHFHQIT